MIYGVLALIMPFYIDEFARYGFSEFRVVIALVQIVGGVGLLLPSPYMKIRMVSAGLLLAMMVGALLTRISIQDSLAKSLPALTYLLINSFIFIKSIKNIK